MTSPTACGARFSARPTPQSLQNLVEPSWKEPIWAEAPKLSAVGKEEICSLPGLAKE